MQYKIRYQREYSRDGASWYFGQKRAIFLTQNYTNNIPEWNAPVFLEERASFFTHNYTNDIPEGKNDTLHQKSSQKNEQSMPYYFADMLTSFTSLLMVSVLIVFFW